MKKYLTLILIVFTCTVGAQDPDPYDCTGLKYMESRYQFHLKRWHDGVNGNGQGGPVDSVVLNKVKSSEYYDDIYVKRSPKMQKILDDLQRYRGLGIFLTGYGDHAGAAKVLKECYNMDVDPSSLFILDTGISGIYWYYLYYLKNVRGLPDDEELYYLQSKITGEVLSTYKSTYKDKIKPKKEECKGKMYSIKVIGPDSVKITFSDTEDINDKTKNFHGIQYLNFE